MDPLRGLLALEVAGERVQLGEAAALPVRDQELDGPQRALGSVDALAARWTSKGAGPQKAASPGALDSRALVFTVSPPQRIGDPELRTLAVRRRAGSIGAWGSLPDDLSGIT